MKALGAFETAATIYNLGEGDVTSLKACVFDSLLVIVPLR